MNLEELNLNTAQFKTDPNIAIDIAYRVCERYYEMGCPEIEYVHTDEDDWYTEGALSGGQIAYAVNGLEGDSEPVFEYVGKDCIEALENGAEACLWMRWGRAVITGPERIKIRVSYPEEWCPVPEHTMYTNRFERYFVPAHVSARAVPHLPANRAQIFEWITKFLDRPRDATGEAGVKFFAGDEGVQQIKSEILNTLISKEGADVVSMSYIADMFHISFEYACELLEELKDEGKITQVSIPDELYSPCRMYGSATEWDLFDEVSIDDDVDLGYIG